MQRLTFSVSNLVWFQNSYDTLIAVGARGSELHFWLLSTQDSELNWTNVPQFAGDFFVNTDITSPMPAYTRFENDRIYSVIQQEPAQLAKRV